jgi:hypothetical protein
VFKLSADLGKISFNLKWTQLALVLLFPSLVLFFIAQGKIKLMKLERYDILILLYFLSNLLSSVFKSGNIIHIKSAFGVLSYVMIYFISSYLIEILNLRKKIIQILLGVNMFSVFFGLFAFLLAFVTQMDNIGVSMHHMGGGIPSIRSLTFEPNLFAIITGAIVCLQMPFVFEIKAHKGKRIYTMISIIAIFLSFTRSVYGSLVFAFLLIGTYANKVIKRRILIGAILISFIVIPTFLFYANNDIVALIVERSSNIANFEEGSALSRFRAYHIGIEGFVRSPILGNGTMSADTRVYEVDYERYVAGTPGWLTGLWIQALHDTGIIGLIVVFWLFYQLIIGNLKKYKTETNPQNRSLFLGFAAANLLLFIATNASSIMWTAFTYVFWAINVSYMRKKKI